MSASSSIAPCSADYSPGKFKPDHKFAEGDHRASQPHFQPEYIKRVNAFLAELKPLTEKYATSVGNLVLNWTIQQPGVTAALVGARDAAQATENAKAAGLSMFPKKTSPIIDKHLAAPRARCS